MVIFSQEMTGKNATKSTSPDSWKKKSDVVLKKLPKDTLLSETLFSETKGVFIKEN